MANKVDFMEIDDVENNFDDKENAFNHSNVLPSTEKGYEDLDVSELNMKLRYSITPASSPMSKSCTPSCVDNKTFDLSENNQKVSDTDNVMQNTMSKSETSKITPLQLFQGDGHRFLSVLRPLNSTHLTSDFIKPTVVSPTDLDDNLSLASSSSTTVHTPEAITPTKDIPTVHTPAATTPTKDIPKHDGGSPIMRGLKSVLNMFRSSQSPIPPADEVEKVSISQEPSFDVRPSKYGNDNEVNNKSYLSSTPIVSRTKDPNSSRNSKSPLKESIVFNNNLEKELEWKDETINNFNKEKLLFSLDKQKSVIIQESNDKRNLNSAVEYMDISYNDSNIHDTTMIGTCTADHVEEKNPVESDGDFVDCETTLIKSETCFNKEQPKNNDYQTLTQLNNKNSLDNLMSENINNYALSQMQAVKVNENLYNCLEISKEQHPLSSEQINIRSDGVSKIETMQYVPENIELPDLVNNSLNQNSETVFDINNIDAEYVTISQNDDERSSSSLELNDDVQCFEIKEKEKVIAFEVSKELENHKVYNQNPTEIVLSNSDAEKIINNSGSISKLNEAIGINKTEISVLEKTKPKNECSMAGKNETKHNEHCQVGSEHNLETTNLPEEIITYDNTISCISANDSCMNDICINMTNSTISKSQNDLPISYDGLTKGFNVDKSDDPFATKSRIRMSPSQMKSLDDSSIMGIDESCIRIEENVIQNTHTDGKALDLENSSPTPEPHESQVQLTHIGSKEIDVIEATNLQNKNGSILYHEISNIGTEIKIVKTENINCEQDDLHKINNVSVCDTKAILRSDIPVEKNSELENVTSECYKDVNVNLSDPNKSQSVMNISVDNAKSNLDTSSFSQSACFTGSKGPKSVFNLPEIEDTRFNPLSTKLNELNKDDNDVTLSKNEDVGNTTVILCDGTSKDETEITNISNNNCVSKTTDDNDETVIEVDTEDEDTVEGPFLDSEDVVIDDNKSEFTQSNDIETQPNEDVFIDAQTFEFWMNQNPNEVTDSGKESLFVKFDPLYVKKLNKDGTVAALSAQQNENTPLSTTSNSQHDFTFNKLGVAGSSTFNIGHDGNILSSAEENNGECTVSKPMMVVPPVVNTVSRPDYRRSVNFTSSAMAVIDRLLSLNVNTSVINHNNTIYMEQNEADIVRQLHQVIAQTELHNQQLRSEGEELKGTLANLELRLKSLEAEADGRLKKIGELNECLIDKTGINKSFSAVLEEYERTIASLIAYKEHDKKLYAEERKKLIKEIDEQTAHLVSMEVAFSDILSKFEKHKQVILTYKSNEETYKKVVMDFEDLNLKMQSNYDLLKQHATMKLNIANQNYEEMKNKHEAELLKLNAMIKRQDLQITSLKESIAQKTKANEHLTAICDELINKVA